MSDVVYDFQRTIKVFYAHPVTHPIPTDSRGYNVKTNHRGFRRHAARALNHPATDQRCHRCAVLTSDPLAGFPWWRTGVRYTSVLHNKAPEHRVPIVHRRVHDNHERPWICSRNISDVQRFNGLTHSILISV